MFNPFKKAKQKVSSAAMSMMQRVAAKKLAKMSPQERAKMMRDALKPENRGKLIAGLEQMRKSGQISDDQYRAAKIRMGIK